MFNRRNAFLPSCAVVLCLVVVACGGTAESGDEGAGAAMDAGSAESAEAEGAEHGEARRRDGGEHAEARESGGGEHGEGRESGGGEHGEADREGGEHGRGRDGGGGEHREGGDEGEHGEEGGHGEGEVGEDSGIYIAREETWDRTRRGARLVLAFNAERNAFVGTVENTTESTLCAVRVEVHLAGGTELGPTDRADVAAGQTIEVELPTGGRSFDSWTAHPEQSPC